MQFCTRLANDIAITTYVPSLQAFQQELESRQGMVQAMKSAPGVDRSLGIQIDELSNVWDRVSQLSDVREARLHEALKLVSTRPLLKKVCFLSRSWLKK